MLLLLRKIVFYLLLVFYLVITPYAILYALGYIFNPLEAELVKTGLISLTTFPRDATVFIQGKKFLHKTPTIIRDLLPGRYTVGIFRKGFEGWEKEVTVLPEKATRLEPVLLLPGRPEWEVISSHPYVQIAPCLEDSKMMGWTGNTLHTLWKIDTFFKNEIPVGERVGNSEKIRILNASCKASSSLILFQVEQQGTKGFLDFDLSRERKKIKGSIPLIPGDPNGIDWDPKDSSQLYVLKDGNLSRVDLRRRVLHPDQMKMILGFGVKHQHLYVLNNDFSLVKADKQGANVQPFSEEPLPGQKALEALGRQRYQIQVFKDDLLQRDLVLFLSQEGTLVDQQFSTSLVDRDVLGIRYAVHSDDQKVLFWTRHQIGVIIFAKDPEDPSEERFTKHLLYDQGQNIRQAFWVYEDSHIIFLDEDRIELLEAKEPAPYGMRFLAQVKAGSLMVYQEKGRSLYFLEPQNGHLVRRKVVE